MQLENIPLYTVDEKNMVSDRIYKTSIPGLYYIDTVLHEDERGFYREEALIPDLEEVIGSRFAIKQLNHARSEKNVIRGFHAEDWNKLITVTHGVCLCVLADIRPESQTFTKTEYILLGFGDSALPGSLFITKGIANSLCVIEAPVDYIYAVDELYRTRDSKNDVAISLFDPELHIQWPLEKKDIVVSDRDKNTTTLREKYPELF
jgi:dTDP-4-dehydrorhamnose 3,5-epimerase